MGSILPVKLGVYRHGHLKGETMRRRQAVSEDDAGDEAARDAFAVFDGYVTAVNVCLLVGVSASFYTCATSE